MPTTYAIIQGNKYMDATLYTGSNAAATIINAGAFQPDMAWFKRRDASASNALNDSVRGVTKSLSSNLTDSEYTSAAGKDLTAFNSNGFSLGPVDVWSSYNASGASLVAWQWKAGANTTVSNTTGTITSTVSANTTAGFSIVTFTSQASGTGTIGHGLGAAPNLIIVKDRGQTSNWATYHSSVTTTVNLYLLLNTTAAVGTLSGVWGASLPTSSVFGITSGTTVQANDTCVAYCWTAIPGFSAFGSYTGNGSSDGPFIYTGFRPKYLLYKSTSYAPTDWNVIDSSRDPYNVTGNYLRPNSSNAEANDGALLDLLSNGFKIRRSFSDLNRSGETYIYAAFAETPFKYANAR